MDKFDKSKFKFKADSKEFYKFLEDSNFAPLLGGEIFLSAATHVFAMLIRFKAKYDHDYSKRINHAGFFAGNGLNLEALWTIGRYPLKQYFTSKKSKIYIYRDCRLNDPERTELRTAIASQRTLPYDFVGILGQFFGFFLRSKVIERFINSKNTFFCSELVADMYKRTFNDKYMVSHEKNPSNTDPQDIFVFLNKSKEFKLLFYKEGGTVYYDEKTKRLLQLI